MALSSDRLRHRLQQEVRHDDHDLHRPQHVHHDAGPLQAQLDAVHHPRVPQHVLHRRLHGRVHPQSLRPPHLLLQRALEPVRFRRRHPLHSRYNHFFFLFFFFFNFFSSSIFI